MKFLLNIILIAVFSALAINTQAQKKVQTIEFHVDGLCEMCKERIEKAVDLKGVKYAEYDVDSKQMEVTFSTKKITEMEIHRAIADIGHDTEKIKASDEAYNSLHHCCKYRDGASCD